MGSLEARMKYMPRISVNIDQPEFIVEVGHNNAVFAELLIQVESVQYNISKNEGKIKLRVRNPKWQGKIMITEFELINPEE